MLSKLILILDKRKELPAKYKKLIENNGIKVISTAIFEEGYKALIFRLDK